MALEFGEVVLVAGFMGPSGSTVPDAPPPVLPPLVLLLGSL